MENEEFFKALQELGASADEPIFSEEEYAVFNKYLTEEQIAKLEHVELLSRSVETLPNDDESIQRTGAALAAISDEDGEKNFATLQLIAEKDPKTFMNLMALTTIAENEASDNDTNE